MKSQRNLPLDAYRGFIMLLLVANGFGFASMPKQPFYQAIARSYWLFRRKIFLRT